MESPHPLGQVGSLEVIADPLKNLGFSAKLPLLRTMPMSEYGPIAFESLAPGHSDDRGTLFQTPICACWPVMVQACSRLSNYENCSTIFA